MTSFTQGLCYEQVYLFLASCKKIRKSLSLFGGFLITLDSHNITHDVTGGKYAIVSNAPLITNDNLACNKRWNGKKGNGLFHNMRDCLLKWQFF